MKKLLNKHLALVLISTYWYLFGIAGPTSAQTQDYDFACMGRELSRYMNTVITGVDQGNLTNIRLLSPAFNMTSWTFPNIIGAMNTAGARFGALMGFAGNLYNTAGQVITYWLDTGIFPNPVIQQFEDKPIYLTEIGDFDSNFPRLGIELNRLRYDAPYTDRIAGSLLFNSFGTGSTD